METGYLDLEFGKIKYALTEDAAYIVEYTGRDLKVDIPNTIKERKVKTIKKKAFLSQKFIKEIRIPDSIEAIEDYAFARCKKLEKLALPYKKIKLGQDILKECKALSYIEDVSGEGEALTQAYNDISFLLAKTLGELGAFFLFDLENAGSDEWLQHLDATISMRMEKDDMEGFSNMILCGEEEVVCGEDGTIEDSNPDHYRSNRVREKVRIALMRLMHDYKLSDTLRIKLNEYLLAHSKGMKTEETWLVVFNEHGSEREYYDYLLKIGSINKDNFNSVLADMGDRHTEIKSYLIKYNDENNNTGDGFSGFEL